MPAELTLGSFDLVGGEGDGWQVETIAEGMSFGAPAGRDVVVRTLLQDGAAMSRDGYDNREVTCGVLITAADSLGLALGEAALAAEIGKRNELIWTPPDDLGPSSRYVVVMSSMSQDWDDWGYMEPGTHGVRWVLSLTCKPFAESIDRVVVAAVGSGSIPPTPVTVLVDDCTSVTNWVGSPNAPATSGGAVRETVVVAGSGAGAAYTDLSLQRDGTVDMTGTPLLRVSVSSVGSGSVPSDPIVVRVGGVELEPVARLGEFVYYRPPTTFGKIEFLVTQQFIKQTGASGATLSVNDITRTNVVPFIGTGRQQFRSLEVAGSARTEGSLQIAHETAALGVVAVYTNADDRSGYQPACRQYRTAGGAVTGDVTTASGQYSPLNAGTPETYDIPSRAVPEGTYAPMARLKHATPGYYPITLTASLLSGSLELGSVSVTQNMYVTSSWALYPLGSLSLPPVAVPPGSLAKVRLKLSSTGAVQVDDTYIFNTTIGALSVVDCGTGTPVAGGPANRLWIDTASLDVPRPAMWVGTLADRSDAHHVEGLKIQSEMPHRFPPGPVNLFTVSDAEYVAASLDFHPAWHSNAAS
jgi:hypothetical protein